MRRALFLCLFLAACAADEGAGDEKGPHDGLSPGAANVLTPTNPAATPKDEDPCIILSGDRFYLAWLSNRDGNDELYVMRSSKDGESWGAPNRVTNNTDAD